MQVVELEPSAWSLLSQNGEFYLDIRTGIIDCAFWILLKLNEVEHEGYETKGRRYIDTLVSAVRRRPLDYFTRNEPIPTQRMVHDAVMAWQLNPRNSK